MVCAKNGKSFNRVYQRDFLRSKTQRNPLPQCFSQCLLKHFPKCFLISPLAWSPFLSIHVCWCFSHRSRRIREGKEEIKVLVSIFSECINFKDYPKSRTCNKIGNFSHSLWLLTEICFNGTPCPQVWPCSGSSDQTGEVQVQEHLGSSLSWEESLYLLHRLSSCCSMSSLFCPSEGKSGRSKERACQIFSSRLFLPVLQQDKQFGDPRSAKHHVYCWMELFMCMGSCSRQRQWCLL